MWKFFETEKNPKLCFGCGVGEGLSPWTAGRSIFWEEISPGRILLEGMMLSESVAQRVPKIWLIGKTLGGSDRGRRATRMKTDEKNRGPMDHNLSELGMVITWSVLRIRSDASQTATALNWTGLYSVNNHSYSLFFVTRNMKCGDSCLYFHSFIMAFFSFLYHAQWDAGFPDRGIRVGLGRVVLWSLTIGAQRVPLDMLY